MSDVCPSTDNYPPFPTPQAEDEQCAQSTFQEMGASMTQLSGN